jgi:hypothetical protein
MVLDVPLMVAAQNNMPMVTTGSKTHKHFDGFLAVVASGQATR